VWTTAGCNSILHRVAAVHMRPFQSVVNAAARLIVRKRKFDHITPTLRDNLHWLPVEKRIEFKLCLLAFKCQHQMVLPYLASMCVQLSAVTRSRQLRSAARNELLIPRTRTAPATAHVASPCLARRPGTVCCRKLTEVCFTDTAAVLRPTQDRGTVFFCSYA